MRRALALALTLLLAALALPAVAPGAANHPFLGASSTSYEDACGLAFGPGGLYVSDYYHDAILGPSGITGESPTGGPCKLAFDPAGNLYVNNWHLNAVRFGAGEFTPAAATVVDADLPTGLAVDPANGDLYVAHHTYVAHYQAPLEPEEPPVATIGIDPAAAYYGVAVSAFPATAGDVYLPDAADHTVKIFDPTGSPIGEIDGAGAPQGRFVHLLDAEVLVDNNPSSPSYGHIYVLDAIGHGTSQHPAAVLDEFNAAGDYRGQIVGFTDAEPSAIAIDPAAGPSSGNVYLTSGNSEESKLFTYGPTAPARSLTVTRSGSGAGKLTSSPAGISCPPACGAEYNLSEIVTLLAAPDAHSTFGGWSVSGAEPCPGTGTCTVLLTGNVTVGANFEEPAQQPLTVSTLGAGSVTSSPAAISCPGTCGDHFSQGRLVTLTAVPDPHNQLLAWSGCDSEPSPTQCTVTLSAARSLAAEFAPLPQQSLAVSLSGSGSGAILSSPPGISCPPQCSASFDRGSAVSLAAAAAQDSLFGGWSGPCTGRGICTLSLEDAASLDARFTIPQTPATLAPPVTSRAPAAAQIPTFATTPEPVQKKKKKKQKKHHHRKRKHHQNPGSH